MTFKTLDLRNEEFWNALTHGTGAVLALIALVFLVVNASLNGSAIDILSAAVFGTSLVLLYLASTFYHATKNRRKKFHLRKADHLCIYLLIAGTYTPVTLVGMKGAWGWAVFGIIWGLVLLGFIFKFSRLRKSEKLSLSLYALMGWLIIIALKPLVESLSVGALVMMGIGGLFYTVGIFFYVKDKIPYNHAIWHLFVLAGSAFHFFGIYNYILP
ncbi:PAQR family membrane homeostasis protein TrhA [Moheibacter sp.]|uniref:PAQR family membrane homeostasis protein TrhA n=1 Tax=Moheibacter sp. TaxID=1965316 RepID=UPI003C77BAA3